MNGLDVAIAKRLGNFQLDAAFSAPAPGVTCLYGPSGAGKSSVLAAIAGALRPDRAHVTLNGEALHRLPMERRAIGWVFQDARLFPHLSVEANLRYGLRRAGDRTGRIGFDDVVSVLGLEPLLQRRPRDLSGGERQRVGMGRALLSQPKLLLMDEPLASLDAARKAEVLPFIERLKTAVDLPILYVTHSFSEVIRLADHLVVMEAGRTLAAGPLQQMLARTDLAPLAGRADAAVALDGVIVGHQTERGLSRIAIAGAELLTPILERAEGSAVRAVVLARDVLLAVAEPRGLSARNVLAATVADLTARPDGSILVGCALAGGARLLSSITRDAVEALALAPGVRVWVIVKSVAVEGARAGGFLAVLDD